MNTIRRHILIDRSTSCTRHEATAILLGYRSFDPIYVDHNPGGDPTEVHEQFEEWLNLSIFDQLIDDRDQILMNLDDATEAKDQEKIVFLEARVLGCDESIRLAKLILCDIDDELAKGSESKLRVDQAMSKESGRVLITLSSLKAWSADKAYQIKQVDGLLVEPTPSVQKVSEKDQPLLTGKGGMTPTSTRSFLVTFGLLLEEFVERAGPTFKSESGTDFNFEAISTLLSKASMKNARAGRFLTGQSESSIEVRIKKAMSLSRKELQSARSKALKSKYSTRNPNFLTHGKVFSNASSAL